MIVFCKLLGISGLWIASYVLGIRATWRRRALILAVYATGCVALLSGCELPSDFDGFHATQTTRLDAGDVVEHQADAGAALPSCNTEGFGVYVGACNCTTAACACAQACAEGGLAVCCTPSLVPVCRCEP